MIKLANVLLIVVYVGAVTSQTFENSSHICSRCRCDLVDDNSTLQLDCSGRQMEHVLANWPKHPKRLEATFSRNRIATLQRLPGSDASIKVIFASCRIKYLETGIFESCVNVMYLDLSRNDIESEQLSSDVFKGPYNNTVNRPIMLEYLDLSYNKIHSLPRKLFEHTPHLKYLSLAGNAMRVLDPVTQLALSSVIKIQSLNLASNRLTELPSDAVKHFSNLTTLDLSYNDLDFVPLSLGYVANSLQIIDISHNPIIEFDRESFEGLENLLRLYADYLPRLRRITAKAFSPLKRLVILSVTHNFKLEEIDAEAFGELDDLEEVYLSNNSLISLPPTALPWSQLKVLRIGHNHFLCNCDLYNISLQLSDATKEIGVPTCLNPRTYLSTEIYSLTNETCNIRLMKGRRRGIQAYGNLRIMRIALTTLTVVLIIAASVAMWLGYSRWQHYKRSLRYPFPNQVVYSPVATVDFPRF